MKSEELELSLRTEFESYLNGVLAGIKQDVSDFQKTFEAEFEKHKAQLDESIRNLSTRFDSDPEFDRAFSESVIEHLRLARDEGATITANAIGAAEKLKDENAPPVSYDQIRDAIKDITSQTSQSAILKSLVEQAGNFAPRGAFFIVKNDHFVGWKAFGKEDGLDDKTVQEVHFPTSADTVFAAATSELAVRDVTCGEHEDDNLFLEPLGFGRPDRMYAIPLTARGRGVAVMYADYGTTGVNLNADALDTLVRVAGLTVELLAASSEAKAQQEPSSPVSPKASYVEDEQAKVEDQRKQDDQEPQFEDRQDEHPVVEAEEYTGNVSYEPEDAHAEPEVPGDKSPQAAPVEAPVFETFAQPVPVETAEEEVSYFEPDVETVSAEEPSGDFAFTSQDDLSQTDTSWPAAEQTREAAPVEEYAVSGNGSGQVAVPEPAVEVITAPTVRSRFGDRNMDLPIEVSEDERRPHNDARRFARLLVSEIKLYNEQKVAEGREANDIYDRLREAIDRSREMYAKRVQPNVAAKFDYFHYELVNGLADGRDESLGQSYPGASS
ncbi:MAG: hypothetical protein ACR2IH_08610 [Pyrinomonadaceae bacterium]